MLSHCFSTLYYWKRKYSLNRISTLDWLRKESNTIFTMTKYCKKKIQNCYNQIIICWFCSHLNVIENIVPLTISVWVLDFVIDVCFIYLSCIYHLDTCVVWVCSPVSGKSPNRKLRRFFGNEKSGALSVRKHVYPNNYKPNTIIIRCSNIYIYVKFSVEINVLNLMVLAVRC